MFVCYFVRFLTFQEHLDSRLMSVTNLYLTHNAIRDIPSLGFQSLIDLGLGASLTVLDLSYNSLVELPSNLCFLSNLQVFNVSNNQLHFIPSCYGLLGEMHHFDLSNNLVERLPAELSCWTNLETIDCAGNPIVFPPPDVISKGGQHVVMWLENPLRVQRPRSGSCKAPAEGCPPGTNSKHASHSQSAAVADKSHATHIEAVTLGKRFTDVIKKYNINISADDKAALPVDAPPSEVNGKPSGQDHAPSKKTSKIIRSRSAKQPVLGTRVALGSKIADLKLLMEEVNSSN